MEDVKLKKRMFIAFILIFSFVIIFSNYSSNQDSLILLSRYEKSILDEFKISYKDEVLHGVDALSICKMYLFAGVSKDYETIDKIYSLLL